VNNAGNRTQGIENAAGDAAVTTPGRNLQAWGATNDFVAYSPIGGSVPPNCGNPVAVSLSQSDFTCADIGDNIITILLTMAMEELQLVMLQLPLLDQQLLSQGHGIMAFLLQERKPCLMPTMIRSMETLQLVHVK
jgi:hypothetical protein